MKTSLFVRCLSFVAAVLTSVVGLPRLAAHCDTLDGPVVKAAQRALAERNIDHALIWVQKEDEREIRQAFQKTLAVRKLGAEAQSLADVYFFETLVRVHRAGEGAPYTGLKPAGTDLGAAVPAADKALETGALGPVHNLVAKTLERGLQEKFADARAKRNFAPSDIAAGRAYVHAYVAYVHFVAGVHEAASGAVHGHPGEGSAEHVAAQGEKH